MRKDDIELKVSKLQELIENYIKTYEDFNKKNDSKGVIYQEIFDFILEKYKNDNIKCLTPFERVELENEKELRSIFNKNLLDKFKLKSVYSDLLNLQISLNDIIISIKKLGLFGISENISEIIKITDFNKVLVENTPILIDDKRAKCIMEFVECFIKLNECIDAFRLIESAPITKMPYQQTIQFRTFLGDVMSKKDDDLSLIECVNNYILNNKEKYNSLSIPINYSIY